MSVRMEFYDAYKLEYASDFIMIELFTLGPAFCAECILMSVSKKDMSEICLFGIFLALIMLFTIYMIKNYGDGFASVIMMTKNLKRLKTGKAITAEDLENLDDGLVRFLATNNCQGHCYWTCFQLLKNLKKGKITFLCIEYSEKEKEESGHTYTAHMIYENNGWLFDTYTCKQYKREDYKKIFPAPEWKSLSYEDIEDLSPDDFQEKYTDGFHAWCEKNDIYVKF